MTDLVECVDADWGDLRVLLMIHGAMLPSLPKVGERFHVTAVVPAQCACGSCFYYQLAEYNQNWCFRQANFRLVEKRERSTETGYQMILDAKKEVEVPAKPVTVDWLTEVTHLSQRTWEWVRAYRSPARVMTKDEWRRS